MSDPRRGPNHYEVLGIPVDAPSAEIRRAYRAKAKEVHPDAGGDKADFERITEAYGILIDPEERQRYDEAAGLDRPSPGAGPGRSWSSPVGSYAGEVEFPDYLREVTERPWRRDPEPGTADDGTPPPPRRHAYDGPAIRKGTGPADVVWWWPERAVALPLVRGPLLLVPTPNGIAALGTTGGEEAWRRDLGAPAAGRPVALDETTVAQWTADGVVHGIDVVTGATRWTHHVGRPGPGGLLVVPAEPTGTPGAPGAPAAAEGSTDPATAGRGRWSLRGGRGAATLVAAPANDQLVGIDTGGTEAGPGSAPRTVWTAALKGPAAVGLGWCEGAVVAVTTKRSVEAVEARRGRHRWRIAVRAPIELPPCTLGASVWLAGGGEAGALVHLDGATGAVVRTVRAGTAVAGLATDGELLFASVAGPARLLGIDEGARIHLQITLARVCPEPAVSATRVYLADPGGEVVVVDRAAAAIATEATIPFEPVGAPLLAGDRLVLVARDGRVFGIDLPQGSSGTF